MIYFYVCGIYDDCKITNWELGKSTFSE